MEIFGYHIFEWEILFHSLQITGIVFIMMVIIDWIDVRTQGKLQQWVSGRRFQQYIVSSFLGVTPGCMGSYMTVSLYMHGLLTMGAVVGGMVATSGEASFVMFAQFPKIALLIHVILLVLGIIVAFSSDFFVNKFKIIPSEGCEAVVYHNDEKSFKHYITEHIWKHIILRHMGKIFLWTFLALWIIHIGMEYFNLEGFTRSNPFLVLIIAALLGIIPDSAPQYIFIFMFSSGLIPFSILLTSSIVQDGHGLLPLLSYSVKDSIIIKIFNVIYGLIIGLIVMAIGF